MSLWFYYAYGPMTSIYVYERLQTYNSIIPQSCKPESLQIHAIFWDETKRYLPCVLKRVSPQDYWTVGLPDATDAAQGDRADLTYKGQRLKKN